MNPRRRLFMSLVPAAFLGLAACATPFRADVSRFQQLPVPQGQTFAIRALDPDKQGGLEFSQYASLVARQLEQVGYRQAQGNNANLIVKLDYDVDNGRERVVSTPGFGGGGWGAPYGGFYRPWYGRRGRAGFYYGWNDPFLYGPGWGPEVNSYTIYTSTLEMQIERAGNGERLFEGRANAVSRSNDLPYVVPNLVEAMFTGFPGNSGETVRISVPPPDRR